MVHAPATVKKPAVANPETPVPTTNKRSPRQASTYTAKPGGIKLRASRQTSTDASLVQTRVAKHEAHTRASLPPRLWPPTPDPTRRGAGAAYARGRTESPRCPCLHSRDRSLRFHGTQSLENGVQVQVEAVGARLPEPPRRVHPDQPVRQGETHAHGVQRVLEAIALGLPGPSNVGEER